MQYIWCYRDKAGKPLRPSAMGQYITLSGVCLSHNEGPTEPCHTVWWQYSSRNDKNTKHNHRHHPCRQNECNQYALHRHTWPLINAYNIANYRSGRSVPDCLSIAIEACNPENHDPCSGQCFSTVVHMCITSTSGQSGLMIHRARQTSKQDIAVIPSLSILNAPTGHWLRTDQSAWGSRGHLPLLVAGRQGRTPKLIPMYESDLLPSHVPKSIYSRPCVHSDWHQRHPL